MAELENRNLPYPASLLRHRQNCDEQQRYTIVTPMAGNWRQKNNGSVNTLVRVLSLNLRYYAAAKRGTHQDAFVEVQPRSSGLLWLLNADPNDLEVRSSCRSRGRTLAHHAPPGTPLQAQGRQKAARALPGTLLQALHKRKGGGKMCRLELWRKEQFCCTYV